MRSPTIAVAATTLAVAVISLAAGCGDDNSTAGVTPAPTTAPSTAPPASTAGTTPVKRDPNGVDKLPNNSANRDKTIAQIAQQDSELATFANALKAANELGLLKQRGPYTVLAPNNDAFTKLGSQLDTLLQPSSKAALAAILKHHIVSGQIKGSDLTDGKLLTTLDGSRLRLRVKDGRITFKNSDKTYASIVSVDVKASNGVVHVIDSVLLPK